MKLQIPKNLLQLATQRLQGAIADRQLSQVGLRAKDGVLEVSAADRVLAVYSTLEAQVETPGVVFVAGKLFSDVVRELPDAFASLELKQSFLVISVKDQSEFEMKLPIVEDMEWKEPPEIVSQEHCELATDKLSYMIDQVQFCIAQDSPRHYGSVGYLHKVENDRLRLVGTDGFRLSYCDIKVDLPESFLATGLCLSKRALIEIQRMCHEGHASVAFSVDDERSTILIEAPQYRVFVRLSSVKFPNYQGVLPTANLSLAKVSRQQMQGVAKRVMLAADKSKALQLCFSNSSLTLSSKTVGSSEGKESIGLTDYRGEEQGLFVNGKFLTDVFSTVGSERITLQFKSEGDPIVIVPEIEPENCRSMHVLVPIRET